MRGSDAGRLAPLLLGISLLVPLTSRAQIPVDISFQGFITDSAGVGLTDTVELTFRLFPVASDGAAIWTEIHPSVVVDEGVYAVVLGSISPFSTAGVDFSVPYWLEVDVNSGGGTETLSPRIALRTVPYAFRSAKADTALHSLVADTVLSLFAPDSVTFAMHADSAAFAFKADSAQHALTADSVLGPIQVDTAAFAIISATAQFALQSDSAQHALVADTVLSAIASDSALHAVHADTAAFALKSDSALHAVNSDTALFALAAQGEITLPFSGAASTSTTALSVTQNGTGALYEGAGQNGGGEDFRVDNDGSIHLMDASDNEEVVLDPNGSGSAGEIRLYSDATAAVSLKASETAGEGAVLELRDAAGNANIILDAEFGGDGRVITEELEITGGADLSELFNVSLNSEELPMPGTVLSIDPSNPGNLTVSSKAYDPMVAGVVSGAGGVETGLIMSHKGSDAAGDVPVALVGRVYVRADASYGAIKPGDLVTSSNTPGVAMRVSDEERAHGAVLGKAMTGLDEGTGLVLVLISLQ